MKHKITLVPGDGIGPEVTSATTKVVEAAGIDVEWEAINAGASAMEHHGAYLPDSLLESIRRNGVALKGPVTTPIGGGFTSINVTLRQQLRLYANLRPIRNLPEVKTRFGDVDLVVIRENTEDLYSGLEHVVVPGVVESLKIITADASTRIARFAFDFARRKRRKRVNRRPQGKHHEIERRPLPGVCPGGGQVVSRNRVWRIHCGQHLHATGAGSPAVRCPPSGEPLR